MIEIENLRKEFKNELVLEDVNLTLEEGKIYGLVGHNGSGKTVLMKCICGLLQPNQGHVTVNGKIVGKDMDFPENVGLMIEMPGFIPYQSGRSNLKNLALIQNKIGDEEIDEVMRMVGLSPEDRKRVSKYSLGMRQRLGIAQAIMENPDILILDEPFNGLDQRGIQQMRELFKMLRDNGRIILLATHMMEDVELLCDEIYEVREHRVFKRENTGELAR